MRRLALTLVLMASMVLAGIAHAAPTSPTSRQLASIVRATFVVPVEWDGVWTTLDSTYDCSGVFLNTSTSSDTICGGQDYNQ
ncbi:MAG: hypothetical protein ACRDL7_04380, partial [Gaiellaceae bacterium]